MGFLRFDGTAGNGLTIPTDASLDDLDVDWRIKCTLATGDGGILIRGAYQTDGYRFLVSGGLMFWQLWGSGGANQISVSSSFANFGVAGEPFYVRGKYVSATETATLYSSTDGVNWTSRGTGSGSGKTLVIPTGDTTYLMRDSGAGVAVGDFYWAECDIDDTPVIHADATALTGAELAASAFLDDVSGFTVSITGTAWRYVGGSRLLLLGVP